MSFSYVCRAAFVSCSAGKFCVTTAFDQDLVAGRKKRRATRGAADAEYLPGGSSANLLPIEDPMRALVSWQPSGGQPGAAQTPAQQQVCSRGHFCFMPQFPLSCS